MNPAPEFPAGPFEPLALVDPNRRAELIEQLAQAPACVRAAVHGLTPGELDTLYRNWSVRQIVHHLADSHLHAYIRFKWALTEDNPTIKAYDEMQYVLLRDASQGDIAVPLALLQALHDKWVQLLRFMKADEFQRTFYHPEMEETFSLQLALQYYPWHTRHHAGQINWMRKHRFNKPQKCSSIE